jgi:hypothetical protein
MTMDPMVWFCLVVELTTDILGPYHLAVEVRDAEFIAKANAAKVLDESIKGFTSLSSHIGDAGRISFGVLRGPYKTAMLDCWTIRGVFWEALLLL